MNIKITRAEILTGTGKDEIWLMTELPEAIWPWESTANARINAASGKGVEWLEANLPGVPFTVINT